MKKYHSTHFNTDTHEKLPIHLSCFKAVLQIVLFFSPIKCLHFFLDVKVCRDSCCDCWHCSLPIYALWFNCLTMLPHCCFRCFFVVYMVFCAPFRMTRCCCYINVWCRKFNHFGKCCADSLRIQKWLSIYQSLVQMTLIKCLTPVHIIQI